MEKNARLEALFRRIQGDENFDPLRTWLEERITNAQDNLACSRDAVDIYRLQGELKSLKSFQANVTRKVSVKTP